ncbi:hypothetical protein [Leptolyngbya sp. KIOST-1]|uniref:hypothetical protein n=1 Tax=Leptolyngbya sp. KIOST-1 TaxID=1229172 RepID=UPI00055A7EB7|nr:hypothetical protein [Leptolyngbya sp. KIOST-1]
MNSQRLRSYISLIEQLLACPSGEEWILLRQNEGLVTPELVQVMEQVATQLVRQGNAQEAKFLHNLAGQIHHLFVAQTVPLAPEDDQSQAYLEFVKALLDCPEGAEGDLLAAHEALIGPGLVHYLQQVAAQFVAKGDSASANYLYNWANELNRLWLLKHEFALSPKPGPAEPSPGATSVAAPPAASSEPPAAPLGDPWLTPLATPELEPPRASPPAALHPAADPPTVELGGGHQQALEAISAALDRLSETLQARPQPPVNPLWYMEVLEQACASGWILASEEIHQLIGVHPTCPKGQDSFRRGTWVFTKAGKLGGQTAWQVSKDVAE